MKGNKDWIGPHQCYDCRRPLTASEVARRSLYSGRCVACCTMRMEHDAARQVKRLGTARRYSE